MTATKYLTAVADCLEAVEASGPRGNVLTIDAGMAMCVERLQQMRQADGEVYLVGNGGSHAIVQHAATDFLKAASLRARVPGDAALITAVANDIEFAECYALSLSVCLRARDVLIAVSSSGESPDILSAVDVARQLHAVIVTCSGFKPDNRLRQMGDLNFYVPSLNYGHVELTHAALLHHITDEVARG